MNILDIIIIVLLILCAAAGYRKGLIRTVYKLASVFIAIFIASRLYAPIARALRSTRLFTMIQEGISNALNLEAFYYGQVAPAGAEIIDRLPLPAVLQSLLHSNNNPSMFELLQVGTMEEYISGFFASVIINIIAAVTVFVLTLVLLAVVGNLLDIVSYLPIINMLNRICGLVFGIIMAIGILWVVLVLVILLSTGEPTAFSEMVENSRFSQWLLQLTMPQLSRVI